MSLIKCNECGKEISSKAITCPNCGYSIKSNNYVVSNSTKIISFLIPIVGLIIYAINIGKNDKLAKESGKYSLLGIVVYVIITLTIFALNVFLFSTRSIKVNGNRLNTNIIDKQNEINIENYIGKNYIPIKAKLQNEGINVIIGNPPYAGESSNKGEWIMRLMETYKKEPGGVQKLQEKNPKWLNDDYVKFIRYAQHVIDTNGKGIVSYINPHGFISNPTFRGMRWSLMQTFNKIYIIDLHGNSNRKETCPDGSKDENVFDIQQGVCICIFVKTSNKAECRVWHADIYGTREEKYNLLLNMNLHDVHFEEVFPKEPECEFRAVDRGLKDSYDKGFSVNDLFNTGAVGLITARDSLNLGFSKDEVFNRLEDFRALDPEVAREKYGLGKDVRDWKIDWAQRDINNNGIKDGKIDRSRIIPVMYRPFDRRYMLYTGTSRGLVCYPRSEVTEHFLHGYNIGLSTGRTNKSTSCDHFIAVNEMIEVKCSERSTGSIVYPLYLYSYFAGDYSKTINMNKNIIDTFAKNLGVCYVMEDNRIDDNSFSELDLFYYMYAMLYSRKYRETYFDFLKGDYPKIPYINDLTMFKNLVVLGKELVDLHTMKVTESECESIVFVDNGRMIDKISFKENRIYINKKSYFESVDESIWQFVMGGYQPLLRWFKDRKGLKLSDTDISHYKKMLYIIQKTISVMDSIDSCRGCIEEE